MKFITNIQEQIKQEEKILDYWRKKQKKYKSSEKKEMCENFIQFELKEISKLKEEL